MTPAKRYLAVFHGPNLDRLGERDPKWYGTDTLAIIDAEIESLAQELGFGAQS
ncbi:MAG: type II 3-dehydroquinate dehydratase, partial [Gemmatimonadetes bacterium]|nr:type II 3-dehydroquinate dehydratase [Gemmatimonadota bacterium]